VGQSVQYQLRSPTHVDNSRKYPSWGEGLSETYHKGKTSSNTLPMLTEEKINIWEKDIGMKKLDPSKSEERTRKLRVRETARRGGKRKTGFREGGRKVP